MLGQESTPVELLSQLTEQERAQLWTVSRRQRHPSGEVVFTPAAHPRSVYLLSEGLVRIYRLSDAGVETTLGYVRPGEVFGELTALGDFPRESFAEAVEASEVWRVPRDHFQHLISDRPELGIVIWRQIGSRLKQIESRVESLVVRDVHTRVKLALLELGKQLGRLRDDGSIRIDVPMTQAELASLVGATRQSVNASLQGLLHAGLISREKRRLVLLRPDALRPGAEATGEA
jgi:CRP-like cAMP-binding protein